MGKWTPNYVDDVLHSKISSLVSGAIRRTSVENEPSITYENFVNELDSGDSFTTSIIDLLVKEVADRRTRANANDRKLISERTIKNLRLLASNTRSYPNRTSGRSHARRAVNLTEYFTSSPNELDMDDDDDEFGDPVSENPTTIEGARVNSDLYDAFATSPWPPASTRRIANSPSPVSDEWPLPPPLPRSPPSSSRPWSSTTTTTASTAVPSNLSRQASIRRAAARSRMVDFHDFTHRRRSTTRDTGASRTEAPAETVTEPREVPPSQTVRRFFPFPRTRRHQTSTNPTWSEFSDTLSPDSDEPVHYFSIEPTAAMWYDHAGDSRASPDAEETDNLLRAPRLRRGGVRAPESMLSRHASPITINTPPTESTTPAIIRRDENTTTSAIEEPVAYPTPGSTENENLA
ncbi:hypothetical protein GALMADRAFT_236632 [Galerina marginata CBS 339.88]|uniref:Uncharacterized protein n=1 Tax=Galerina marginata (strain CBS 339.88) TaxID=685588 RepID=A0A067TP00_GALM3|nr:hypothetical protein GALMADRAFT_236632 [Galerina marginata CBS 339.88]